MNPLALTWLATVGVVCMMITRHHLLALRRSWPEARRRRNQPGDPIVAWKAAYIEAVNGRLCFRGLTGMYYQIEDEYNCHGEIHNRGLPRHCTCGFYALNSIKRVYSDGRMNNATWLLQVELYGTVHEGTLGYRAEKQRVLSVYGICHCGSPATGFVYSGPKIAAVCANHRWGYTNTLSELTGRLGTEVLPLTQPAFQGDIWEAY